MTDNNYKYSEMTYKIISCAMEVHKALGTGFQEKVYQKALEEEFLIRNISFVKEKVMSIFYKGKYIGERRVDFLVEDIISVELKALTKLEDIHLAQAINYLEAYNLEVGLLINFGAQSLEFKRLWKPKNRKHNQD